MLLHRNMKRVRENVKVIQKDGRGRSLSVVTRSEYRASADLGVMEINDTQHHKSDEISIVVSPRESGNASNFAGNQNQIKIT